jgi:hypothetical protein
MLLAIPYQTLEVGKVHIDNFRLDRKGRSLAPLTYKDAFVDLGDLTLLTPDLPVVRSEIFRLAGAGTGTGAGASAGAGAGASTAGTGTGTGTGTGPERGRLILDVTGFPVFQTKLNTLQEYIAASMYLHRQIFFDKDLSAEEVKAMLQPLLVGPHLYLYTYSSSLPRVSEKVKLVVRIHGILKLGGAAGGGRSSASTERSILRIQHSVFVQP